MINTLPSTDRSVTRLEGRKECRNCTLRSYIICSLYPMIKYNGVRRAGYAETDKF
jgi:hypothetical protein